MKKRIYISVLAFIMSMGCLASWWMNFSPTAVQTIATPNEEYTEEPTTKPIATQPATYDTELEPTQKDPINISVNSAVLLPMTDEEISNIESFSSSDGNVAVVDDGGRIDALGIGSAVITAHFLNGTSADCLVTVENEIDLNESIYSTCVTANEDIEAQNVAEGKQNPYAIYVNRQMNTVTVYTYDSDGSYTIPVRAMVASCGADNGTILGDFSLYFTNEWQALYGNVYGHYVSGISGDYLFHSVPYYQYERPDTLEIEEFNKLGTSASMGCVRLSTSDTKWIFEHCVVGTYINIYDDDNPGPLGKPETITITDFSCGWDPTDNDARNPYNSKTPQIDGATDVTLSVGDDYNLMEGITAVDTCGNDVTEKVEAIGNVITSHPGTYKVSYHIKDALNRTDTVEISVTVE